MRAILKITLGKQHKRSEWLFVTRLNAAIAKDRESSAHSEEWRRLCCARLQN